MRCERCLINGLNAPIIVHYVIFFTDVVFVRCEISLFLKSCVTLHYKQKSHVF